MLLVVYTCKLLTVFLVSMPPRLSQCPVSCGTFLIYNSTHPSPLTPHPLPPSTGQPPPSHVCHARGAQGLDLLAGVHGGFKVSWQVPLLLPHRQHTPGVSSHQEPLHLDQSRHYHSQYHCGEALGRPGELEIVISLPRFVFFLLSNFCSVFPVPMFPFRISRGSHSGAVWRAEDRQPHLWGGGHCQVSRLQLFLQRAAEKGRPSCSDLIHLKFEIPNSPYYSPLFFFGIQKKF